MRARYNFKDNTLKELPNETDAPQFGEFLSQQMGNLSMPYSTAMVKYLESLRTFQCASSCKEAGWKDGQVLEEGKDYRIVTHAEIKHLTAIPPMAYPPLKPLIEEDQDALIREIIEIFERLDGNCVDLDAAFGELEEKYIISRRKS